MPDSLDVLNADDSDEAALDLGPDLTIPPDESIDMHMQFSLLNHHTYNVSVAHELDGLYDEQVTIPVLAVERAAGILWVLMTSGFFHRIRVNATAAGQYYHIRLCEATMVYQGHLS